MTQRTKIALIVGSVVVLILGMAVCAACIPRGTPANIQEPVEHEDCDKEDQAKGQWWEGCTLNLKPSVKPSPKPVLKTPAPPVQTPGPVRTTKKRT